ncbi:MAG: SRPBCC family protein, partial [Geminicoccaceae bacterium]
QQQEWRSAGFWQGKITPKYAAVKGTEQTEDPMASGDFTAEDIHACEQQQKSLISPYFEHGPSSLHGESSVRAHQKLVKSWMEERS